MVERFDMMNESEVVQEITPELSNLKLEVKDEKEFERLLQDPVLQGATEKIFNQMSDKAFGKEREKLNNVNVSKTLKQYERSISGLQLHIKFLGLEGAGNFKDLTNEQKINFMALNTALKTEKGIENIIKKTKELQEKYAGKMTKNLEWTSLKNFFQIKNMLGDYGLNNQEIEKFQELVKLIDKNAIIRRKLVELMPYKGPGWEKMCSVSVGLVIGLILVGVIAGSAVTYILMSNKDKDKPRKRIDSFTHTGSMKEISEWVTYKDDLYSYEHGELKMCEVDDEGNFIQRARNVVKSGVNYFQNRKIDMIVEGTVQIKFPLENEGKIIEHYDADTGTFTVDLYFPEEPTLDVVNVSTKVLNESTEAVRMDDWKDFQSELMAQGVESIKQQAIKDGIIEKGQEAMTRKVMEHYKGILDLIINDETGYKLEINVHYMNELPPEFQSTQQDSVKLPKVSG